MKSFDGFENFFPRNSNPQTQTLLSCKETEQKKVDQVRVTEKEPDIIDVDELMRDLLGESESDNDIDDKENIRPPMSAKNPLNSISVISMKTEYRVEQSGTGEDSRFRDQRQAPLSEMNVSEFRRPDLDSSTLFDPDLLAAFQQVVVQHIEISEAERKARAEIQNLEQTEKESSPSKDNNDPLSQFEEKCPPGGSNSVIFYTTSLRGIRKTFEGCNSIRFLLESFRVVFYEKDVSMHNEYREELWRIFDDKAVPPRLFIKGRYIGGAEEVLGLHEQGKLRPLFEGFPTDRSNGPCESCGGVRFVLCFNCNGSHRVIDDDGQWTMCLNCNENGLIVCSLCC